MRATRAGAATGARATRPRGLALASVMFVIFMVLLFGLTLASVGSYQYQSTYLVVERHRALEAAEAGVARAIYAVADNPNFGAHGEGLQEKLADGSSYRVSFVPSAGLAWSLNNFQSASGVAGWHDHSVPPYCALLVASGTSPAGQKRVVEALVQAQTYSYAVACSGTVQASGGLTVRGSSTAANALAGVFDGVGNVYAGGAGPPPAPVPPPPPPAKGKGNDNGNGNGNGNGHSHPPPPPPPPPPQGPPSLISQAPGIITGQVVLTGGNGLFSTEVDGGVQTDANPQSLPDINISQYSNSSFAGVTNLSAGNYPIPLNINGPTYVDGNLTLQAGANLNNAYLFVNGNLDSHGPITGSGSLFVNGHTDLHSTIQLSETTTIAVFSNGNLTLHDDGVFQGLLYCHQTITTMGYLEVVGAVIAQGPQAQIKIQAGNGYQGNLIVTFVPEYVSFASNYVSGQSMSTTALTQLYWREEP